MFFDFLNKNNPNNSVKKYIEKTTKPLLRFGLIANTMLAIIATITTAITEYNALLTSDSFVELTNSSFMFSLSF